MRKGLLLSAAGLLLVGSSTAYGACTPVLKCASLGYKYSSSECSEGGLACPFDTSKYFCAEPCTYTVTKATCDSQCKNVGDKPCVKNGTIYYEACGSSKCGTGYTCTNGSCTSTCNYSYTAASCSSQCKNVGSTSCVKDGTTYYSSCGSSKCSSGQKCNNGTCVTVPTSGFCCGYSGCDARENFCQDHYGKSCYQYCRENLGYPDCNDMVTSCRASGGSPRWVGCYCGSHITCGTYDSHFICE